MWILFLNSNGTVKSEQKGSYTAGGFGGSLDDIDEFGLSVSSLGDLDGDGIGGLAAGAPFDDDGGEDRGAVWILSSSDSSSAERRRALIPGLVPSGPARRSSCAVQKGANTRTRASVRQGFMQA